MRVTELKALARDHGLRNYSRMRKAELVALLQNNPSPGQSHASAAPTPRTRPPPVVMCYTIWHSHAKAPKRKNVAPLTF